MLHVFFLCASKCPIAVASSVGGNLVKLVSLSPVNGGKNPFCSAFRRVDIAGENSAACANVTRSAGVLVCLLMTGAAWYGVHRGFRLSWIASSGNIQRPWWFRGHCMLVPSGFVIVQCVAVKVTSHPLLHRGATASKEFCKCGKICAVRASIGIPVMGNSAVCVE